MSDERKYLIAGVLVVLAFAMTFAQLISILFTDEGILSARQFFAAWALVLLAGWLMAKTIKERK
jgi:hypothetical protein